jgi:hypothetical protein
MPHLSSGEAIYLIGVISAFSAFAITLGSVNLILTLGRRS